MISHAEYEQALTEAMARHTYGLETTPPDEPPRCPHCKSGSLYTSRNPEKPVRCNNCGRYHKESDLK